LSSYRRRIPIFTSAHRACDKRPEHAVLAAKIVGLSASIDAYFGSMLVTFLGSTATPSFAMYEAIHQTAKTQALRAAARVALDPEGHDVFQALMTLAKAADKHRNRLSHWLWAYSEAIEDGLLLIDPEANFEFLVEIAGRLENGDQYGEGIELDYSRVLVYRREDLIAVIDQFERIAEWLSTFHIHLVPSPLHSAPGLRWHQLATSPEMLDALKRIRGGRESGPPKPPLPLRSPAGKATNKKK
jgi:hypothetical protein